MPSLLITGIHKDISMAEIFNLYGEEHFEVLNGDGLISDLNCELIDFKRLGGSLKLAKIIKKTDYKSIDDLKNNLYEILLNIVKKNRNNHKLVFGISIYGLNINPKTIISLGSNIKKSLLKDKKNIRFVPNKDLSLNAAQVINNKLLTKNNIELIVYNNNNSIYIAKNTKVQNINDYSSRDFNRPARDSKNGMLPPKLAQIIINLGPQTKDISKSIILDPFCGSGVMLQEALIMGSSVIGTDINPVMVDNSIQNLNWIIKKENISKDKIINIYQANAENTLWQNFDFIATETTLGPPLSHFTSKDELNRIIFKTNQLITNFLTNLSFQIKKNQRFVLAVPTWKKGIGYIKLPVIDYLEDLGYTFVEFNKLNTKNLVYIRSNQLVGRQLLVLRKI